MWALDRGTLAKEKWRNAAAFALATALTACGFGDVKYDDAGTDAVVDATPGFASAGSAGTGNVFGLPPCTAAPLSERCLQGDCPAIATDVQPVCPPETPGAVSYRHATTCRGTAIELDRGPTHEETWYYDQGGALTGVTLTSEQGPSCVSVAGTNVTSVWGEVCAFALSRFNMCDVACPLLDCQPRADILGDFPLGLEQLTGKQLHACRGLQCLTAIIDEELQLGQNVPLYDGTYPGVSFTADHATLWLGPGSADSLELHLTWTLEGRLGLQFPAQDLYLVALGNPNVSGPPMAVFETLVEYQVADLGCAGSCRFADVDVRKSATTAP